MSVHAYAALQPRAPLQPFDYKPRELAPFDVEIMISHCGVCHSDVHLIDNDWGISQYPLVPGHEVIGIVTALGTHVDRLSIGERVGVGWQANSCLQCEWCLSGYENLCQDKQLTCVGRPGGFADHICVDSRFTFPIPKSLDSAGAAPLLCAGVTIYSPMRRYSVQPCHRVGVVGIGGLGHLALQFAHRMGCEVTAFSTHPDKEDEAHAFGADLFVTSNDAIQMEKATRTLDFIFVTAIKPLPWEAYMKMLRPNGRLTIVSPMTSETETGVIAVPTSILVGGQKTISGSVIGGRGMMHEMLAFAARHRIVAQTEIFPFVEINQAIRRVRDGEARYRVVLQM